MKILPNIEDLKRCGGSAVEMMEAGGPDCRKSVSKNPVASRAGRKCPAAECHLPQTMVGTIAKTMDFLRGTASNQHG